MCYLRFRENAIPLEHCIKVENKWRVSFQFERLSLSFYFFYIFVTRFCGPSLYSSCSSQSLPSFSPSEFFLFLFLIVFFFLEGWTTLKFSARSSLALSLPRNITYEGEHGLITCRRIFTRTFLTCVSDTPSPPYFAPFLSRSLSRSSHSHSLSHSLSLTLPCQLSQQQRQHHSTTQGFAFVRVWHLVVVAEKNFRNQDRSSNEKK